MFVFFESVGFNFQIQIQISESKGSRVERFLFRSLTKSLCRRNNKMIRERERERDVEDKFPTFVFGFCRLSTKLYE